MFSISGPPGVHVNKGAWFHHYTLAFLPNVHIYSYEQSTSGHTHTHTHTQAGYPGCGCLMVFVGSGVQATLEKQQ